MLSFKFHAKGNNNKIWGNNTEKKKKERDGNPMYSGPKSECVIKGIQGVTIRKQA